MYETIMSDLKRYDYELAVARLKESKPKETKVESDEELKKKWMEEGERRALEKSGGLNAETGQPSGVLKNEERIRDAYRKNPYGEKEYKEYHELTSR